MDAALRLLARLVVVPLGYLAAVIAGAGVILLGAPGLAAVLAGSDPYAFADGAHPFALAAPLAFMLLFSLIWVPAVVGILIAEAFAIRSWIFHALNGAIGVWLGREALAAGAPAEQATLVFGAGLASGFAYWAVAGWNAGFWRPVFKRDAPRTEP